MEIQHVFNIKSYDSTKAWLEACCGQKFNHTHMAFHTLAALLRQHPSFDTWKNKNPASFHITRSKANKAIQLMVSFHKLTMSNGVKGETKYRIVSWVTCAKQKIVVDEITGEITRTGPKAKTPEDQLNGAMRNAIRKQISNFRAANLDVRCQICTGQSINNNQVAVLQYMMTTPNIQSSVKCEVDHYPKRFVDIKNEFLADMIKKGKPSPTEFVFIPKKGTCKFKNGSKADDYYDKKWKLAWQRFHNKHANYRYLCPTCNRKTNQGV